MIRRLALVILLMTASALPAQAQTAPYEDKMLRLGVILGSLHYLRNLCGEKGNAWRERMEEIMVAEKVEGERRQRFIASFNRGYRGFASAHTVCTDASMAAIDLYMKEGEALARDIAVRFGS